jgi:hypothetical protein
MKKNWGGCAILLGMSKSSSRLANKSALTGLSRADTSKRVVEFFDSRGAVLFVDERNGKPFMRGTLDLSYVWDDLESNALVPLPWVSPLVRCFIRLLTGSGTAMIALLSEELVLLAIKDSLEEDLARVQVDQVHQVSEWEDAVERVQDTGESDRGATSPRGLGERMAEARTAAGVDRSSRGVDSLKEVSMISTLLTSDSFSGGQSRYSQAPTVPLVGVLMSALLTRH